MTLNAQQFRMQTNMKAAPNSQGTLFQGGNPTPATGKPWPRGYSPERRDAVAKAMPGNLEIASRGKRPWSSGTKNEEYAQGLSTIARSTVPIEHVRGLEAEFGTQRGSGAENIGGTYYRGIKAFDVTQGHASGPVAIHEIGHHVSNITETPHSASQRGEIGEGYEHFRQRGQEEGFAENYAETHYRDRRGKSVAGLDTSAHGWRNSYGMSDEHDPSGSRFHYFSRGFDNEREKSPGTVRQRAATAALHNGPGSSGIRGQLPLLQRVTTQSREYINARGDRGPDKVSWDYADLDADPKWMPSHQWRQPAKAPVTLRSESNGSVRRKARGEQQ